MPSTAQSMRLAQPYSYARVATTVTDRANHQPDQASSIELCPMSNTSSVLVPTAKEIPTIDQPISIIVDGQPAPPPEPSFINDPYFHYTHCIDPEGGFLFFSGHNLTEDHCNMPSSLKNIGVLFLLDLSCAISAQLTGTLALKGIDSLCKFSLQLVPLTVACSTAACGTPITFMLGLCSTLQSPPQPLTTATIIKKCNVSGVLDSFLKIAAPVIGAALLNKLHNPQLAGMFALAACIGHLSRVCVFTMFKRAC